MSFPTVSTSSTLPQTTPCTRTSPQRLRTRIPGRWVHHTAQRHTTLHHTSLHHSLNCVCFPQYLDQIRQAVSENLRLLAHSPSVQMHQVSSVQWVGAHTWHLSCSRTSGLAVCNRCVRVLCVSYFQLWLQVGRGW